MPAVDPARLRRQIEDLGSLGADPVRLRLRILELFDFYRDRTRRPTAATRAGDPGRRTLGVSGPVLRAVARGLDEVLPADGDVRMALAAELWGTGLAEAQSLAACVAGTLAEPRAAEWVAAQAGKSDSRAALRDLAEHGLASLRHRSPQQLLEILAPWMSADEPRLRALAYYAAAVLVAEDQFEAIPDLLSLIQHTLSDAGGFPQPALQRLIEALARRSPPEAARMLIDELGRAIPGMDAMVRLSAPAFPPIHRGRLERALSALRRTGIIPPS